MFRSRSSAGPIDRPAGARRRHGPGPPLGDHVHVLLVASAFNSLTQRVHAELRDHGHSVAVELALSGTHLPEAVRRHRPDLIIAPMLKTAVPEEVWSAHTCLIVHPGPVGDRGPSSLDWAVHDQATRWGVTVLQAEAEMDAGAVWAFAECPVPQVAKSDLYRGEIADAALQAVLLAVHRFASGTYTPAPRPPAGPPGPAPGAPPDRLAAGLHRTGPAAPARRRLPARRARRTAGRRMVSARRPPGPARGRPARPSPESSSPPGRVRSAGPPATAPSGSRSCGPAARRGNPPR